MKLALLCSATFLVGVIAACGSDGSGTLAPFTTTGPGRTPSRPPSTSSSSGDIDENGFCPSTAPLTEADLDAEIGWKPASPSPGACTAADLKQLQENFSDTSLRTYLDLGKDLSSACRTCVISKDSDAKWGPIVAVDNGQSGFVNLGACFGAIEGDACGKAIQYESFCTSVACDGCASTQKELAECVTKSTTDDGICAPFASRRTSACPSWALNVKSCGTVLKAVQTLCGAPPDAGAADGG